VAELGRVVKAVVAVVPVPQLGVAAALADAVEKVAMAELAVVRAFASFRSIQP